MVTLLGEHWRYGHPRCMATLLGGTETIMTMVDSPIDVYKWCANTEDPSCRESITGCIGLHT